MGGVVRLDALLGRSLPAQIVSVGGAGAAGVLVYMRAVLAMRVPEAHQVSRLIRTQLGQGVAAPGSRRSALGLRLAGCAQKANRAGQRPAR